MKIETSLFLVLQVFPQAYAQRTPVAEPCEIVGYSTKLLLLVRDRIMITICDFAVLDVRLN